MLKFNLNSILLYPVEMAVPVAHPPCVVKVALHLIHARNITFYRITMSNYDRTSACVITEDYLMCYLLTHREQMYLKILIQYILLYTGTRILLYTLFGKTFLIKILIKVSK